MHPGLDLEEDTTTVWTRGHEALPRAEMDQLLSGVLDCFHDRIDVVGIVFESQIDRQVGRAKSAVIAGIFELPPQCRCLNHDPAIGKLQRSWVAPHVGVSRGYPAKSALVFISRSSTQFIAAENV